MVIRSLFAGLFFFFVSCSGFLKQLTNIEPAYQILRKAGNHALVLFRVRPREGDIKSLYIMGTFNQWSFPGKMIGNKAYPLVFNKKTGYWRIKIWLPKGVHHYLYVINQESMVADEKCAITRGDGRRVSRLTIK